MGSDQELTLESTLTAGGIAEAMEDEFEARRDVVVPLRRSRPEVPDQFSGGPASKTS